MRKLANLLIVFAALSAGAIYSSQAAHAQGFWSDLFGVSPYASSRRSYERSRRFEPYRQRGAVENRNRAPSAAKPADRDGAVAAPARTSAPQPPLVAVVSLKNQSMTVWGENGPVLQSRVSTGQPGHSTPAGVFSVIQKNRYHESNIYSGAPMPFMQRITWSGIAMHAGVVPNYPASHGCIRLPYDVAQKLFGMTRMGMRVVVAPADTQAHWIEHETLPQPYLMPLAELTAIVKKTGDAGYAPAGESADAGRLFNPNEVASRLRTAANNAVKRRAIEAKEALAEATWRSAEANAAAAQLRSRRADLVLAEAEARSNALIADSSDTIDRAAAKMASDQRVIEARTLYQAAIEEEAAKSPPSFDAARAAREAQIAADEAPDKAKEIARRLEPLSIFVSRQERHVFIRQGFEAVLEAAVDIADIDTPLGTHTFTAMATADEGRKLRWLGVTMPGGQGDASSAQKALSRITLPDHVRDEIARRVWTGASLVISDQGVSNETGRGTDFVVLMK
jgi:L,D-transpeptidase catalytic domain